MDTWADHWDWMDLNSQDPPAEAGVQKYGQGNNFKSMKNIFSKSKMQKTRFYKKYLRNKTDENKRK